MLLLSREKSYINVEKSANRPVVHASPKLLTIGVTMLSGSILQSIEQVIKNAVIEPNMKAAVDIVVNTEAHIKTLEKKLKDPLDKLLIIIEAIDVIKAQAMAWTCTNAKLAIIIFRVRFLSSI